MDDEDLDLLNNLLTVTQRKKFGRRLHQVMRESHGEVYIRIVQGKPAFIGVRLEERLEQYPDPK